MTFSVSRRRSLVKTILYRILGTIETFLVVWIMGGSVEMASMAAIILMIVKLLMYYLYERVWNFIDWGRN